MTALEAAMLRYRPRTIPLIGKRPAVGCGWPDWAATPESIRAWLADHGGDPLANVGIRTGNGLIGVDIDPRHDAARSLARLEQEHGPLPATCEVATGGGGRHLYYRTAATVESRDLQADGYPGVEIKGTGRQLVAPPSVHPDTGREYVWIRPLVEADIALLPGWLTKLATKSTAAKVIATVDTDELAARDPLHRIPPAVYVPRLTGRPINRAGYVHCPVHGADSTPSLKVYPGGWKCYGCDRGGRIYQLAGWLGGFDLPLNYRDRQIVRGLLIEEFAEELAA